MWYLSTTLFLPDQAATPHLPSVCLRVCVTLTTSLWQELIDSLASCYWWLCRKWLWTFMYNFLSRPVFLLFRQMERKNNLAHFIDKEMGFKGKCTMARKWKLRASNLGYSEDKIPILPLQFVATTMEGLTEYWDAHLLGHFILISTSSLSRLHYISLLPLFSWNTITCNDFLSLRLIIGFEGMLPSSQPPDIYQDGAFSWKFIPFLPTVKHYN